MTLSWSDFRSQRNGYATQFFPAASPPASAPPRTILFASHIWWTDQMAFALLNLGYNVLFHFPFYLLYSDPQAINRFDAFWSKIIADIRTYNVSLIIGGNSSALLPHPKTGELLHEVARPHQPIPLVNWWWDEVRTKPPLASALHGEPGCSVETFLKYLGNANSLNAIWDIDVKEELESQFHLRNLFHLPLATLPEFWPYGYVPLEDRPFAACFLGNCHFTAEWCETDPDPLMAWAHEIVSAKLVNPDRPMQACAEEITTARGFPHDSAFLKNVSADPWVAFVKPWDLVNAVYMHRTRNLLVQAASEHLKGKLVLIGKGWEKLRYRANMEHAADKSGVIYGQSHTCLNLFGGCVHGGMPLRPYDIATSGGLILTHYQRELPSLFEPERECLAFRTAEEMIAQMEKVRATPREFNAVALAGRKRIHAEHTWTHRLARLMAEVDARFPTA